VRFWRNKGRKEKEESEKGKDKAECPMRKQFSKMKAFSVNDYFDFGSSESFRE
jgi:hypothetical protein